MLLLFILFSILGFGGFSAKLSAHDVSYYLKKMVENISVVQQESPEIIFSFYNREGAECFEPVYVKIEPTAKDFFAHKLVREYFNKNNFLQGGDHACLFNSLSRHMQQCTCDLLEREVFLQQKYDQLVCLLKEILEDQMIIIPFFIREHLRSNDLEAGNNFNPMDGWIHLWIVMWGTLCFEAKQNPSYDSEDEDLLPGGRSRAMVYGYQ